MFPRWDRGGSDIRWRIRGYIGRQDTCSPLHSWGVHFASASDSGLTVTFLFTPSLPQVNLLIKQLSLARFLVFLNHATMNISYHAGLLSIHPPSIFKDLFDWEDPPAQSRIVSPCQYWVVGNLSATCKLHMHWQCILAWSALVCCSGTVPLDAWVSLERSHSSTAFRTGFSFFKVMVFPSSPGLFFPLSPCLSPPTPPSLKQKVKRKTWPGIFKGAWHPCSPWHPLREAWCKVKGSFIALPVTCGWNSYWD